MGVLPKSIRRSGLFAVFTIVGVLLAACGVPGETGPGAGGPSGTAGGEDLTSSPLADRLVGRSFETRDAGDVAGFALVDGSTLTLNFDTGPDGRSVIGAGAGCNSMGGPVAWDGDTFRPVDGFARTEMACDGLMEQEDWFFALLNAGVTLTLEDPFLTITGTVPRAAPDGSIGYGTVPAGPAEITMIDSAVANPDVPLAGYTWRLDGIISGSGQDGAVSSVPAGLVASMMLSRDPVDDHLRLDVFDGLSWLTAPGGYDAEAGEFDGSVAVEPTAFAVGGGTADANPLDASAGTVRVSGMAGDAQGCAADAPPCRVDEMELPSSDFTFETDGDRLTVMGTGRYEGHGLTFVIDPDAPTPNLDVNLPAADNPLLGRTFELTRTFTDAGGADHKDPSATLRLTFGATSIAAQGSCGEFSYDVVRYLANPKRQNQLAAIDLGEPSIADCTIGTDPPMPPFGTLMFGTEDGPDSVTSGQGGPQTGTEISFSTGFVMWIFRAVP